MFNTPVRQHWVPKVYLRAFRSDPHEQNQLYVRDLRSKRTFLTSIDNAAVKKNFYTLQAQSERPSFVVEKKLASLEAEVAPVLAHVRSTEALPETEREMSTLAQFLGTLHMRTRQGLQMIHGFRRDALEQPGDHESSFRRDLRDFNDEDMRELFANSSIVVGASLGKRLLQMHWRLFRADEGYFLTSESPVLSYHGSEKQWGLGTPGVKTFCSISPKLLLLITNEPFASHVPDPGLPASAVNGANGLIVCGAEQFLFSHQSFEPVQGLITDRERRNEPEFGPTV